MKMNKKGFTLIEMLVVIAIIAILVSIVVPTVSSATEKAKEAKDAANIRTAIAQATTEGMAGNKTVTVEVNLTQKEAFDQNADLTDIAGYSLDDFNGVSTVVVTYNPDTAQVTVTADGTTLTPSNGPTTEEGEGGGEGEGEGGEGGGEVGGEG